MFLKFIPMSLAVVFLLGVPRAEALIFISEILADPASGLAGDANGDGISSSNDDEFIELYNPDNLTVDLSGWSLSDALRVRHVFPLGAALPAHQFLAVFGSTASTGTLSLNNTGDTVTIFEPSGNIVDQVNFGSEAGVDQSIVRLTHDVWEQSMKFSPGYLLAPVETSATPVPEPITIYYFLAGMAMIAKRKITA